MPLALNCRIAYEGITDQVISMTVEGKLAFAPIVWSTDYDPVDFYLGSWRSSGTGMISFYISGTLCPWTHYATACCIQNKTLVLVIVRLY